MRTFSYLILISHLFGSFTKDASEVRFTATGQILSCEEKKTVRLYLWPSDIVIYNSRCTLSNFSVFSSFANIELEQMLRYPTH